LHKAFKPKSSIQDMDNFIVIPAYNEEKNIAETLSQVKKYASSIIVVNDGSSDSTQIILDKMSGIIILTHIVNLGKGTALKTGCEYAIKRGAKKIVVMDSDGQHDPQHIPQFLAELEQKEIVFGCRQRSTEMPFVLRFGNWFLNKWTEILFGITVSDTQSGYRAFTAEAYSKIKWDSQGYSVESEMIARAGKEKLKYKEIPIKTIYQDKYKGTTILDGMKIALSMLNWKIRI